MHTLRVKSQYSYQENEMNSMIRKLAVSALLLPALCFAEVANPIPAAATIREIMNDVVRPSADVLWGATAVYITEEGEDDRSPTNDEEWLTVDESRIAMERAIVALSVPGRLVDAPDAPASDEDDLKPAEIEALIRQEPEVWAVKLRALGESMVHSKKAIEDQDVEALTEIGAEIDEACESCHQHFWYPEN
jgi:hypothetical protein